MSSVGPGDWLVSKSDPSVFLEVLTVAPDGGVRVRIAGQEANTTKRYLLNGYAHLEDDSA
ncbi:hypothetical protein [Curtobacterium sp. Arg-1]|uniref:hypothetical protein n=1 Tax=Curtobacterium sp. Arg-1 TaxID=2935040 RepID=UPI0021DAAE42|nr:hypothetical protein [Curtobacterium sp. Arg-1]UXZ57062.1 hypothetical protein MXD64_13790 [Curtobacterium sp. Arg-1]